MINELGNVTVLWEELWLSTLQDLHMGKLSIKRVSSALFCLYMHSYDFMMFHIKHEW